MFGIELIRATFQLSQFMGILFFFTDTDDSQDSRAREGTIFYFILPVPLAHEYPDIHLKLCIWDDYHIFLIPPLIFTLSNYHFIDRWCEVTFFCLFTWWFDSSFIVTAIWDGKPVVSNSHRLSPLYYRWTD